MNPEDDDLLNLPNPSDGPLTPTGGGPPLPLFLLPLFSAAIAAAAEYYIGKLREQAAQAKRAKIIYPDEDRGISN